MNKPLTRVEKIIAKLGIVAASKSGQRLWALCPFHKDRTPDNWFIRYTGPRKGQNWCFSCKGGGSLFDLVMHVHRCDFKKARAWLKDFGDDAPPPAANLIRLKVRSPVEVGFQLPAELIADPLEEWVSDARKYAVEDRGITPEQIARWRIGYAVDGRLGGRLIFVVRDARGVPAGYSARTFVDHDKRYLMPNESERSDLDVMFGEEFWPPLGQRGLVVLVEGAINGLAVERALAHASEPSSFAVMSGSHARPIHLLKVSTFKRVVILSDADVAGDGVAEEYAAALARHTAHERVRLGEGEDAQTIPLKRLARLLCPPNRKTRSSTPTLTR
jgi:DNA primase